MILSKKGARAGAKCDHHKMKVRTRVRAHWSLDVRGACVRHKKRSQPMPCCLVSKAFSYVQLGIPQTLLLYCPHLFSLSNALHWFGLSACGTTWPFDLQVHSKVGVIHKWRIFFLGFWHHSHMPTVFYTFSSVNFDQFSIPSFPSRMYFMNNPGPRHLSANKGNGYV